jgi:hypothetical protein
VEAETAVKKTSKPGAKKARSARKGQTAGESIIEGLKGVAWTRGENDNVRVTLVDVPDVDVRECGGGWA